MSMSVNEIQSVTNLLKEIKNASTCCMKYNEQSQALIDKLIQNMKKSSPDSANCDNENQNKANGDNTAGKKTFEDLDYLENILLEKMQENAKLKALNERLLRNSREKSHKIKELTRAVSLQSQRDSMSREVSVYKDKIGKCNVEIQKLKKQLDVETKKLQNEKTKASRSKNSTSIEGYRKSADDANKILPTMNRSFTSLEGERKLVESVKRAPSIRKITKSKHSFKELDEILIEKTLVMIKLNGEPSISDETFDEPMDLSSDTEAELSDETCKESSDEPLKESTGAEIDISSGITINDNSI